MIRKVVIPAAGLGTRLFPATKEQPKEMLPIFSKLVNNNLCVKPLLHLVFEQLYDAGFREFCFVVGREKRTIEDHFTPDLNSLTILKNRGKNIQISALDSFYTKLKNSTIVWVNQPEPKGFGNSVLMAQPFIQNEHCLVHAGDTYIISPNAKYIKFLIKTQSELDADSVFIVQKTANLRQFGIIEADETSKGIYRVKAAIEKPEKPPSNLAILPIYAFHPVIFKALKKTDPDKGGEVQLTDAIQKMIDWGMNVYAISLDPRDAWLDIGSPDTYWNALQLSYKHACGKLKTTPNENIDVSVETLSS